MRLAARRLLSVITGLGLFLGFSARSSALGCKFPLISPPPYTFQYSWEPGPRTLLLSVDDHYNPTDTE